MYAYMYVYMYVYVTVCICMTLYVYISIYTCICVHAYIYTHSTRRIDYSASCSRTLEGHVWRCVRLFPGGRGRFLEEKQRKPTPNKSETNQKNPIRYYKISFNIALNSLFNEQGVYTHLICVGSAR